MALLTAFFLSFFVQLGVCFTDAKVIAKLVPLLIELAIAVCLIILSLPHLSIGFTSDARLMLAIYGFITLIGIAGIGLAWIIYTVKWFIYDPLIKANKKTPCRAFFYRLYTYSAWNESRVLLPLQ